MIRAAAIVVLLGWLPAPPAAAHSTAAAFLQVIEQAGGRALAVWRAPRGLGATLPQWPSTTRIIGEPLQAQTANSVVTRQTIGLGEAGLAGVTVGFPGLRRAGAEVIVRVDRLDGTTWNGVAAAEREAITIGGSAADGLLLARFATLGLRHILFGADHLLFILGLVALVPQPWRLAKTVTAFTLAHSLSLAAATFGAAPPAEPVNAAIALSLVFLGAEMVFAARQDERAWAGRRPWALAFGFGLLHGLGYAGALSDAGLGRADLPAALLGFNFGVEAGQIGFVLMLLLLGRAVRQLLPSGQAGVMLVPAYVVGCLGAAWTIDRTFELLQG